MRDVIERARRWCLRRADAVVAVVLIAAAAVVLGVDGLWGTPAALAATLSTIAFVGLVAWRRRWPITISVLAGGLATVPEFTRYADVIGNSNALTVPVAAAVFLYAYALGSDRPWWLSLPALAVFTVALMVSNGGFNPFIVTMTVGPWLVGAVVASRRRVVRLLEDRARELDEERDAFAAQSVRYERARIARELHDIVAHCVSLMVVQASAGEHLAHQDPHGAAEAFDSISEAARQAEVEIDRLVNLLDTSTPASPPAGLRIVEELVGRVRASGLRVSCQFSGDVDDLSEATAETAHRLVQEAITNAMKHAPAAPIDVTVRGRAETIDIVVVNQPAAGARSGLEGAGGGHGLAGMRERVSRCGGTFDAGPSADRGWHVTASLPRGRHRAAPARSGIADGVAQKGVAWP